MNAIDAGTLPRPGDRPPPGVAPAFERLRLR